MLLLKGKQEPIIKKTYLIKISKHEKSKKLLNGIRRRIITSILSE